MLFSDRFPFIFILIAASQSRSDLKYCTLHAVFVQHAFHIPCGRQLPDGVVATQAPSTSVCEELAESGGVRFMVKYCLISPTTLMTTIKPWTSLICVSSPKCVYMCVRRCSSQTPNAFICVSPNAFVCVSPNAFVCVSPNMFTCVSRIRNGARFARLPLFASLARFFNSLN